MIRSEKIELIKQLLMRYMNLPENSGLTEEDAKEIFENILSLEEEELDKSLILLAETLQNIGLKIKNTNNKVTKMIISDNEQIEKVQEQQELTNLFSNF